MQLMYWMQEGQEAPPIVGVPSASLFNSMCGFPHGRCDWRPGFFNAHFAPSSKPMLDTYAVSPLTRDRVDRCPCLWLLYSLP